MELRKILFAAALPAILVSCGGRGSCQPYVAPSFNVSVFDAATMEGAACGVTVELLDTEKQVLDVEAYPDAPCLDPNRLIGVGMNHNGELSVRITKDGYEPWESEPMEVVYLEDACHVITLDLDAHLEPAD